MICLNCGETNVDDYRFCRNCGVKNPSLAEPDLVSVAGSPGSTAQTVIYPDAAQPPSPPEYSNPVMPPPPAPKKGVSKGLLLGGLAAVLGLCFIVVVVAAVLLVPRFFPGLGNPSYMVIGYPDRNGKSDLYLVRLGQPGDEKGTLLVKDAAQAEVGLRDFDTPSNYRIIYNGDYNFSHFVNDKQLLFWYADGRDISLSEYTIGADAPVNIMDVNGNSVYGRIYNDGSNIYLSENRSNEMRCYVSRSGGSAERLAKGDDCWLSLDSSHVIVVDRSDRGQTTLSLIDTTTGEKFDVLDDEENVIRTAVSADASYVAYVAEDGGISRLFLVDAGSGEVVQETDAFLNVWSVSFGYSNNTLVFVAENEDGDLVLNLMTSRGTTLVSTGLGMVASLSTDAQYLVYMTADEDDERTIKVYNIASGENTELISGADLNYMVLSQPDQIIVFENDEGDLTIYQASTSETDLVEIWSGDDYTFASVSYIKDNPDLYIFLTGNGGTTSLYFVPQGNGSGFYLIDEWDSIKLLNVSGDGQQLVFTGIEDSNDDPVLYTLDLQKSAKPVEIDDDLEGVANAVYHDTDIVYTAQTGRNYDDVEVRQVTLGGKGGPATLYTDAFLAGVQWGYLWPFETHAYLPELYRTTAFCPGADLLNLGSTIEASLSDNEEVCYRLVAPADEELSLVFQSDSNLDAYMTLYDRNGSMITADDNSGPGLSPLIITTLAEEERYYVRIHAAAGQEGSFTISLVEGAAFCPGAETLSVDATLEGDLNRGDEACYLLDAPAGELISIIFNSDIYMDPWLVLYDAQGNEIERDDDSGVDYFPLLQTTLVDEGPYYVKVVGRASDEGEYTISLVEGSAFCPGADVIEVGSVVNGNLPLGGEVCYELRASPNQSVTFAFASTSSDMYDPWLYLYDEFGNEITRDDDSGPGYFPLLRTTLPADTVYYVKVVGRSGDRGAFTLSVTEGSEVCANAEPLYIPDSLNDTLPRGGEVCYILQPTENTRITIEFSSSDTSVDPWLYLYDDDGYELDYDDDSGDYYFPRLSTNVSAGETYYVKVVGRSSSEGPYVITVTETEMPPDSFLSAVLLPYDTPLSGTITSDSVVYLAFYEYSTYGAVYYFEGVSGRTVEITVIAQSEGSDLDSRLYLFDSAYEYLESNDDANGYDSAITYTLSYTGRYYILLEDFGSEYGSNYFYQILLTD